MTIQQNDFTINLRRLLWVLLFFLVITAKVLAADTNRFMAVSSLHPRLYLTKENIPKLKEKIQKDACAKKMWDEIIERANKHLASPVPRPDTNDTIRCSYLVTARKVNVRLQCLSLSFLISGNKNYLEKAKEIIDTTLSWDIWVDPTHGGRECRLFDLATGELCWGMALGYDWLYDYLTPEERGKIRDSIIKKGLKGYLKGMRTLKLDADGYRLWGENKTIGFGVKDNWCGVLNGGAGVAGLALLGEYDEAGEVVCFADKYVKEYLDAAPKDGCANEGGLGYYAYGMWYANYFVNALKEVTRGKENLYNHPYMKITGTYPLYAITPDLQGHANFGDSAYGLSGDTLSLMLCLARENRNPYYQWLAKQSPPADPLGLIWYDEALAEKEPDALPFDHFFNEKGVTILRSGWKRDDIFLALETGPNRNRDHLSINNFILNAYGERLLVDPGYPHYYYKNKGKDKFSSNFNVFGRNTIGHNTFLIDGNGQRSTGGRTLDYFTSPCCAYVTGEVMKGAYDPALLNKYLRHVLFMRPDYFVIMDELSAPKAVKFESLLHSYYELERIQDWVLIRGDKAYLGIKVLNPSPFDSALEDVEGNKFIRISPVEKSATANFLTVLCPGKKPAREGGSDHRLQSPFKVLILMKDRDERRKIGGLFERNGFLVDYIGEKGTARFPATASGLRKYDAIFMSIIKPGEKLQINEVFSAEQVQALADYVKEGGGLFVSGGPGSFGVGGFMNTPLEELLPVKMTCQSDMETVAFVPGVVRDSAVLKGIPGEWPKFGSPNGGYHKLVMKESGTMLMKVPESVTGGAEVPFLAMGEYGNGRVMVFNSTWAWGTGKDFVNWKFAPQFLAQTAFWLSRKMETEPLGACLEIPKLLSAGTNTAVQLRLKNYGEEDISNLIISLKGNSGVKLGEERMEIGKLPAGAEMTREIAVTVPGTDGQIRISAGMKYGFKGRENKMSLSGSSELLPPLP
ncbi:MAG: glutamine amidotransferase, partial [Candidatus Omnitrophota bacterium]